MNEHRESSDEALDELLRRAEWPAIDPTAERRLRETWRTSFDRPRPLIWRPWLVAAAAAAVALAALAGWWVLRIDAPTPVAQRPHPREVQPVVSVNYIPRGETRRPTPFERLIVTPPRSAHAVTATAPKRAAAPAAAPAPALTAKRSPLALQDVGEMNQFLERVVKESTRADALRELREMQNPPIDALLRQLANPHVARRFAAARALGEVCRPEVVEVLWRMVARDVYRREALAALTHCHEPQAGRYLAIANGDPGLESQLRSVREQMKQSF